MERLPAFRPNEQQLMNLLQNVKDWQLNNGSLLKLVLTEDEHSVVSRPIGSTLYPSRFPRECFEDAKQLQTAYNKLYAIIANNEEWLREALSPLMHDGSFASRLWNIHETVKKEGYVQDLTLGLFRSDYMLHRSSNESSGDRIQLKQVEFNTVSCAGLVHSGKISAMHRHLCRAGYFENAGGSIEPSSLPDNNNLEHIVEALIAAHNYYEGSQSSGLRIAILMVVQPMNINVCDERPIEYALWEANIPVYRVTYGEEVIVRTKLTPRRELVYFPPGQGSAPVEVSLVYMRAGLDEREQDPTGLLCRLQLERSRAIKCPSVLSQLTGFKVVQQALSVGSALFEFRTPNILSANEMERIAATFMPQYLLDETALGLHGREIATNLTEAVRYVLKPSLEGGGHNVYRDAIPDFLMSISKELWKNFVLMEMIEPPPAENILMSPRELHVGAVESELGILGACLWCQGDYTDIRFNNEAGFSLKTKPEGMNEMSVVKGFGCFDSPTLIDPA